MTDRGPGEMESSRIRFLASAFVAGPLGAFGMVAFLAGALEILGPEVRAFWTALIGALMSILIFGFLTTLVPRAFGVEDDDRGRLFWAISAIVFSFATWLGATLLHLRLLARVSTVGVLISSGLFAALLGRVMIRAPREKGPDELR